MTTDACIRVEGQTVILYLRRPEYPQGYKVVRVPLNSNIWITKTEDNVKPTLHFGFEESDAGISS